MPDLVTQEKNGVLVIYFAVDSIRSDIAVQRIGEELFNLTHSAKGKVLLDFSKLQQMSSMMIGKILALNKECTANNITLKLCNLEPHIDEVFRATGLRRMLGIYETQEQALASFKKKWWFW